MGGNTIPWPMPNQQAQPQQQAQQSQSSPFIPAPFSGQELAAQALHLQSAGSSTQLPANMMPHIKTYQPSPNRPYTQEVGKGNMRGQGIGKAVSGLANIVGAVTTEKQNNKQMEMASQVSTLLQNQHEIEQAQQTLQANPNDADAKALIQHNQTINANILKDDKLRKHIQEGMKIDFTDPSANQTESHSIVQKGKAMAEKMIGMGQKAPPTTDAQAQGYAQKFAAGTPQQMQPNQAAIAKYQMMQQANAQAMEVNKAMVPLVRQQMIEQGKVDKTEKDNIAKLSTAYVEGQVKLQTTAQEIAGRKNVASIEANAEMSRVYAKANLDFKNFQKELDTKNADPGTQMAAYSKYNLESSKGVTAATDNIAKLETQKNAALKAIGDKSQKARVEQSFDDQINQAKTDLEDLRTSKDSALAYYKKVLGLPDKPKGDQGGTGQQQPSTNTPPGKSLGTKAADWVSDSAHNIFKSGADAAYALRGGDISNLFKDPDDLKQ